MRALAIVLAVSVAACSFIQIPKVDEDVPAPCNRSTEPVKVDLITGTLTLVAGLAVILFIEPRDMREERNIPGTIAGTAIGLTGVAFLVSAKLGSSRAQRCREMQSVDKRYGVSDDE